MKVKLKILEMSFSDHIIQHRNAYLNRKEDLFWQNTIRDCNENVRNKNAYFIESCPPSFYSGQLYRLENGQYLLNQNTQVVIITMNPMFIEGDDPNRDPVLFREEDEEGFFERMNNWFIDNNRNTSVVYRDCQKLVAAITENDAVNDNGLQILHDNAVVLDWFPFYSKSFDLSIVNEKPLEYFQQILDGLLLRLPNAVFVLANRTLINLASKVLKLQQNKVLDVKNLTTFEYEGRKIYNYAVTYKGSNELIQAGKFIGEQEGLR